MDDDRSLCFAITSAVAAYLEGADIENDDDESEIVETKQGPDSSQGRVYCNADLRRLGADSNLKADAPSFDPIRGMQSLYHDRSNFSTSSVPYPRLGEQAASEHPRQRVLYSIV